MMQLNMDTLKNLKHCQTDSQAPCEKFDNTVMLGPTIKDRVLSLIRTIIN